MLAKQPSNRRITHVNGWVITTYFSEQTLENLRSRDPEVRELGQRAVCTKFRASCELKYKEQWTGEWVEFKDLTLTDITSDPPRELVAATIGFNPNCRCDTKFRCPEHD